MQRVEGIHPVPLARPVAGFCSTRARFSRPRNWLELRRDEEQKKPVIAAFITHIDCPTCEAPKPVL